jgi:hypothetical protein
MHWREQWAARRVGLLIGATLAVGGAAMHRSRSGGGPVLGRWSLTYTMILAGFVLVLGVLFAWSHARADKRRAHPNPSAQLFDAAILTWGIASLLAACASSDEASRVVDGAAFGSAVPHAVALDGLSIALLVAAFLVWAWVNRTTRFAGPLLVLATVLVVGGIGELAVRARAVIAPLTQGFPTYTSALWERRFVRLNQSGFRDRDHATAKRGCRIAVVGDSYAFGAGIRRPEDRLGERVAADLTASTGRPWEPINASRGDSHTLQEMAFLKAIEPLSPDVIILLYVFNDIDYLAPVTPRAGVLTEAPRSLAERLHPVRLLFHNSFLFQETVVVTRLAFERARGEDRVVHDPYRDSSLVEQHLRDVAAFVALAGVNSAVVRVVPMDVGVATGGYSRSRYAGFVAAATRQGLPVVSLEHTFDGQPASTLTVNWYDRHPNARADALAATSIARHLLMALPQPLRCGSARSAGVNPAERGPA